MAKEGILQSVYIYVSVAYFSKHGAPFSAIPLYYDLCASAIFRM